MNHFVLLFFTSFFISHATAAQEAQPFFDHNTVNLVELLPTPPANDSIQTKTELAEVLSTQALRTPEQIKSAQEDAVENIWRFSKLVNHPQFIEQNLPKFSHFFLRIVETEAAVTDPAKDVWKRPRPFQMSPLVKPVVQPPNSWSYPSGHATVGTMMGLILAQMIPEKRTEILQRAAEFANNRLVAGVHFRSDIEMGRTSGTIIVAILMTREDFKMEFEAAQKELREVLGADQIKQLQ